MKQYQTGFAIGGIHYFAKWEHHFGTSKRQIKVVELAIVGFNYHDITAILHDDLLVHDQFIGVLLQHTLRMELAEPQTSKS
jgi:hypothetical protein